MKVKRNILDYIYFGFFGILVILFVTGSFSQVTGFTLVVIDNEDPNSMFPTYFQGDLFLLQKANPEKIELGDVIVYEEGEDRIIHRVVDIVQDGGNWFFRVKGDNPITNFPLDRYGSSNTLIPYDSILGKVVLRMPYIGHISLAMQQNQAVKFMVYILVILIGIAIFFWPEDEEDEEEQYVEFSFAVFKSKLSSMQQSTRSHIVWINTSGHRFLIYGMVSLMILLLIVPMLVAPILPQDYNTDNIGVDSVTEISRGTVHSESAVPGASVVYIYLTVHLYDNTMNFRKIKGFTLSVYMDPDDESTKLSEMVWQTRRTMKGSFAVGGAVLIPVDKVQEFNGNVELTIVVELDVRFFGAQTSSDPFVDQFNFDSSVVNTTVF